VALCSGESYKIHKRALCADLRIFNIKFDGALSNNWDLKA
jgi:hypothetical protein